MTIKECYPSISIVIPTLNAAKALTLCLQSIKDQDYPKNKIQIIIADAYSTDNTRKIAKQFQATVIDNPLKTGEAGKAVGIKKATGELIALVDSDNILPDISWLVKMVKPFKENSEVVLTEPWEFTYRKTAGKIERYCALFGVNDPFVLYMGNYDKLNRVKGIWTEVPLSQIDHNSWIEVTLSKAEQIPTIGANGTILRASFLSQAKIKDYLFDIDLIVNAVKTKGNLTVAKVKVGIIHTYCEDSILKFARKQRRRIMDFTFHDKAGNRTTDWQRRERNIAILRFSLDTVIVIPHLFTAIKGYSKIQDFAWFLHPLLCMISLFEYARGVILGLFVQSELDRSHWIQ